MVIRRSSFCAAIISKIKGFFYKKNCSWLAIGLCCLLITIPLITVLDSSSAKAFINSNSQPEIDIEDCLEMELYEDIYELYNDTIYSLNFILPLYSKLNLSDIREYNFKLTKHKVLIINRNYLEIYLLKKAEENGTELFIGKSMKDFKPPNTIILENNEKLKGLILCKFESFILN